MTSLQSHFIHLQSRLSKWILGHLTNYAKRQLFLTWMIRVLSNNIGSEQLIDTASRILDVRGGVSYRTRCVVAEWLLRSDEGILSIAPNVIVHSRHSHRAGGVNAEAIALEHMLPPYLRYGTEGVIRRDMAVMLRMMQPDARVLIH